MSCPLGSEMRGILIVLVSPMSPFSDTLAEDSADLVSLGHGVARLSLSCPVRVLMLSCDASKCTFGELLVHGRAFLEKTLRVLLSPVSPSSWLKFRLSSSVSE